MEMQNNTKSNIFESYGIFNNNEHFWCCQFGSVDIVTNMSLCV